jgi:hypothetical protein
MIVRSSFKRATCGQSRIVRIGMGKRLAKYTGLVALNVEDMVVALNVVNVKVGMLGRKMFARSAISI